mmetsp:Transcript_37163/g.90329  ORF Transcript_37163/g.90329 Transcript_37163/m.90329 type:complete len:546 (-) Transcript_37163:90-1727(-)
MVQIARINSSQKEALRDFFAQQKWPRNKTFPRENGDQDLDKKLKEIGLDKHREKASRQLAQWKKEYYDYGSVTFDVNKSTAREIARSHMVGVVPHEFVKETLRHMLGIHEDKCTHYKNLKYYLLLRGDEVKHLLEFVMETTVLLELFSQILKLYENLLVKVFPSKLVAVNDATLDFNHERQEKTTGTDAFCTAFLTIMELLAKDFFPSVSFEERKVEWIKLFAMIESCLYDCWAIRNFKARLEPIEIPESSNNHPSSNMVIAYVCGWILSCLKTHKGMKRSADRRRMQPVASDFFKQHSVCKDEAAKSGVPTGYFNGKGKQGNLLHYPSLGFFKFLCLVESAYMHNYNLRMLSSYADGSLIRAINGELHKNSRVRRQFVSLCTAFTEEGEEIAFLLKYILEKFRNMRLKYLGKSHKGLIAKGSDRLDKGALRTRVLVAVKPESKKRKSAQIDTTTKSTSSQQVSVVVPCFDFEDDESETEDSDDDTTSEDKIGTAYNKAALQMRSDLEEGLELEESEDDQDASDEELIYYSDDSSISENDQIAIT